MAETTLTAPAPTETEAPAATPSAPDNTLVIDKTTPAGDDWRATLPEDLKSDTYLARYKSPEDAFRALSSAQKTISQGLAKKPGPDAKPEEVARYRESLGVPKVAAEYALDAHDLGIEPAVVDDIKGLLWKHGVPAEVATALVTDYVQWDRARLDRVQQEWVQGIADLKAKWGQATFNRRATAGFRLMEQAAEDSGLGWDTVKAFLDTSRLGDHPILFQLLGTIGERNLEDGIIHGEDPSRSPDLIRQRLDAIYNDKAHPFNQDGHPEHKKAVDEVHRLTQEMLGKEGRRVISTL